MSKPKVLLVEDDDSLGFVITDNLDRHGYKTTWCSNGEEGLEVFQKTPFDLCILDIMLPKKDGVTLAKEIRSNNTTVPILFLTAKSILEDKLEGFRAGADDYICKPFSMEELLCRTQVFLRRKNTLTASFNQNVFTVGAYLFDAEKLLLKHPFTTRTLTPKEAALLKLLIFNRDRILKREDILNHIWGDDDYFIGRSMDVFISRLRKYLSDDPSVQLVNYHGVGFRLEQTS